MAEGGSACLKLHRGSGVPPDSLIAGSLPAQVLPLVSPSIMSQGTWDPWDPTGPGTIFQAKAGKEGRILHIHAAP